MLPAGFEPAIAASEWPQTHAVDRAAAGIGYCWAYAHKCSTILSYSAWLLMGLTM